MNIKEYKFIFMVTAIGLIIGTSFTFFYMVFPYPVTSDKFFVLSVLGNNSTASDYYPHDNPNIGINDTLNWNIYVQNYMQEAKYVLIKIKIVNSSDKYPDSLTCTPSTGFELMNVTTILSPEQYSIIPFTWRILNYSSYDDFNVIHRVEICDVNYTIEEYGVSGSNSHFIFELWYYDIESDEFKFEWLSGSESYCAWNKLRFNLIEA
ncbi:hypothetical protein MCGE09_00078 [Thaumarchaeota archaeon SCGC AB-539-E09]|nr:hypothetical protein MCGE09_00078 [Thaumarchaeota archaeon SCGC AB-539-E09]